MAVSVVMTGHTAHCVRSLRLPLEKPSSIETQMIYVRPDSESGSQEAILNGVGGGE